MAIEPVGDLSEAAAKHAQRAADSDIYPPPNSPMPVARTVVERKWRCKTEVGTPTLVSWQHVFHRWDEGGYVEIPSDYMETLLYRQLEHAVYVTVDAKGQSTSHQWEPNSRRIGDLVKALHAVVAVPDGMQPPDMLSGTIDGLDVVNVEDLVSTRNGIVHRPTRTRYSHTPRFFTVTRLPFDFDPDAPTPDAWLNFLNQLWPDDPDAIKLLQEMIGYLISGRTDLQKAFLWVGPTRSGRGTISRVVTALLGPNNRCSPTLSALGDKFGMEPLIGKSLAVISDARLTANMAGLAKITERLLTATGEDDPSVHRKFKTDWDGRLRVRVLVISNEVPIFHDASGALPHRFETLTFFKSFLGMEDETLTKTLTAPASLAGIFNWALDGLDRLDEQGGHFTIPKSAASDTELLRRSASEVRAFVAERCVVGPERSCLLNDLYVTYHSWCLLNGYKPSDKTWFGRDLKAVLPGQTELFRGEPDPITGRRRNYYQGIAVA